MGSRFLLVSFLSLLAAVLIESPALFALSGVSVISGTALAGSAPKPAVILFWLWTNGILLFLLSFAGQQYTPVEEGLLLGLPLPAFAMLFGIWIALVLIWPVFFLIQFKNWIGR